MAGYIDKNFINELLTRVDIIEVIDARVPLKKAGSNHTANCPFHDEKSPSFTVSPSKQFYHCFGCGKHGNAISFLMEYDRLGFVEAVESLATAYGMTIQYEDNAFAKNSVKNSEDNQNIHQLLAECTAYYQQQLKSKSLEYLTNRGLSQQTIDYYHLGYAPAGWDNILQKWQSQPQAVNHLQRAGMLIHKENGGHYDRFRNRVMFPIRDRRGRVVGFGGRVMNPEDNPKYLNSPETPIFHKSSELYGLYEVLQAKDQPKSILIVEGYMDVLGLFEQGIKNAVATLGTATTKQHLLRLYRLVDTIVFCFDGDRAGKEAAWRALKTLLPILEDGRQAYFMFLPEGEDPDSYVRTQGQVAFQQAIEQAMPLSKFLFATILKETDVSHADGKAKLSALAMPLIQSLPNGAYKQLLIDELNKYTGIKASVAQADHSQKQVTLNKARYQRHSRPTPVRLAIALLLQYPHLIEQVNMASLQEVKLAGIEILKDLCQLIEARPEINTAALCEHWRGTDNEPHIAKLASWDFPLGHDAVTQEFRDVLAKLIKISRDQEIARLLNKAGEEPLTLEEKTLLQKLITYTKEGVKEGNKF